MICRFQPEVCAFWNTHIEPISKTIKKNGGIYLYPTQAKRIVHLVNELKSRYDDVHICESGFGSGHFTSMMLLQNKTSVTVFDIFSMHHQKKLKQSIQTYFKTVRFISGDTYDTLRNSNIRPCHLVHISVPQREQFDLYNFRRYSFSDTIVTFTSLNKYFDLYKNTVPIAHEIGFISNVSCEGVENVSSTNNLFMSVSERYDQIHCWSTYRSSEFGSNTYEDFLHRILQSRSGRGPVAITYKDTFTFDRKLFTNVPVETVARRYNHNISYSMSEDWILLWVHYFTTPNFCKTLRHYLNTKVITYMLFYISDPNAVSCLLDMKLRVYSLLKNDLNTQIVNHGNESEFFVFATYGNDLPIPYKFQYIQPDVSKNKKPHKSLPIQLKQTCKGRDTTPTLSLKPHVNKSIGMSNKKLIVILIDAVSNKVLKKRFPETVSTLKSKNIHQVQNYVANDEYSGPNQKCLYFDKDWLWNELSVLNFVTLKIENICKKYSALMHSFVSNVTHGPEFDEYFCNMKTGPDCINGTSSLNAMLNISQTFITQYQMTNFAAFIHVESFHEDSMSASYYLDKTISNFLMKVDETSTGVVFLSDHGFHYGVHAFTSKGYDDIFHPFAFTNLNVSKNFTNHFGMKQAIRKYLRLNNAEYGAQICNVPKKRETRRNTRTTSCHTHVPSIWSFQADTNSFIMYNCSNGIVNHDQESVISNHNTYSVLQNKYFQSYHNFQSPKVLQTKQSQMDINYNDKVSIYVIEIDSLSKHIFDLFFVKTRKILSQLSLKTNVEFTKFNIVGVKSIPNQAALLSRCEHTYGHSNISYFERSFHAKSGFVHNCSTNLFDKAHVKDYKTFFGEEFCDGKWSVRKVLNIQPTHLHDNSYCTLGYDLHDYFCNGKDLTSMFVMDQIEYFMKMYNNDAHFVFASLILLHNINHKNPEGYLPKKHIQLLNSFDDTLSKWIVKMVRLLLKSERKFLLVFKGDHGFRYDHPDLDTYETNMYSTKPFFHIVSNIESKFIFENSNKLTSPFDFYDVFSDMLENKKGKNLFDEHMYERTCEESGIKKRFCACPFLI